MRDAKGYVLYANVLLSAKKPFSSSEKLFDESTIVLDGIDALHLLITYTHDIMTLNYCNSQPAAPNRRCHYFNPSHNT